MHLKFCFAVDFENLCVALCLFTAVKDVTLELVQRLFTLWHNVAFTLSMLVRMLIPMEHLICDFSCLSFQRINYNFIYLQLW